MEKKGEKRVIHIIILSIFMSILLIALVSAGFFDWVKKITGKATTQTVTLNITVGVPQIITVNFINRTGGLATTETPIEASSLNVYVNFSVYSTSGAGNLNDSTARVNFTRTGETTRQNLSCAKTTSSGNYANYTCNVTMWWWDGAGAWNIAAAIADNLSNWVQNTTVTFTMNSLSAFVMAPSVLTWPGIAAGATNQTSNNDPLLLNNTGNYNISLSNIQINTSNLRGETDSTKALWAGNFSVASFTGGTPPVECNATATIMNRTTYINITGASLPKGNYTINDGSTGQEQLYFCLRLAGSELTTQAYSTANETEWAWIVRTPS